MFSSHDSKISHELSTIFTESRHKPAIADSKPTFISNAMVELLKAIDGAFMKEIRELHMHFGWRRPGFGKIPEPITRKIAVVEILGTDGMIHDDRCRFGLLFQE